MLDYITDFQGTNIYIGDKLVVAVRDEMRIGVLSKVDYGFYIGISNSYSKYGAAKVTWLESSNPFGLSKPSTITFGHGTDHAIKSNKFLKYRE